MKTVNEKAEELFPLCNEKRDAFIQGYQFGIFQNQKYCLSESENLMVHLGEQYNAVPASADECDQCDIRFDCGTDMQMKCEHDLRKDNRNIIWKRM